MWYWGDGDVSDLNIVVLGQLRCPRLEHCGIGAVEMSETSTVCVETKHIYSEVLDIRSLI